MDKRIQERVENLDNCYYLLTDHTDSILHSPTYLLNQCRIFPKLYHSFDYHHHYCLPGKDQILRLASEAFQVQMCAFCSILFFLWLSSSSKYLKVSRISVLIHNSIFFPSFFFYQDCSFPLAFFPIWKLTTQLSKLSSNLNSSLWSLCWSFCLHLYFPLFFPCNFVLASIRTLITLFYTYSQACSHSIVESFPSLLMEAFALFYFIVLNFIVEQCVFSRTHQSCFVLQC